MGMQQMLMITLGVIIVGIMIVAGIIPAFEKGMQGADRDAITQDCLKIAAAAQGYYRKPSVYGGGSASFSKVSISDVGMKDDGTGMGENQNGSYEIDGSAGTNCTVIGHSKVLKDAKVTVVVYAGHIDDPAFEGWP